MKWFKKLSDAFKIINKDYEKTYNIKEPEPEETLEQWKERVENDFLKIRGSKIIEDPYSTYFFNYCVYCNQFYPERCFSKKGELSAEYVLQCSKVRLNNKLLQKK